jgi:hypothetical protein
MPVLRELKARIDNGADCSVRVVTLTGAAETFSMMGW